MYTISAEVAGQEVIFATQLKNMAAASGCQELDRMMAICENLPSWDD